MNTTKSNADYVLVNDAQERGHLYRKTTDRDLVVRSFDHPCEVTPSDLPPLDSLLIWERYEGTVIRVRYDTKLEKTIFSTHGNIDAHAHKWGSRRFGVVFDRYIMPKITVDLTQAPYCDYVFIILLQDPENKMVCQIPLGGIHLTTLDGEMKRINVDIGLPTPTQVFPESTDDLVDMMEDSDPLDIMGFVAMYKDTSSLRTFNITLPQWEKMSQLRDNNPHLVEQFLTLNEEDRPIFAGLFPEYMALWQPNSVGVLDRRLDLTIKAMTDLFRERHVEHKFIRVEQHIHRFMQALMDWRSRQLALVEVEKQKPMGERRHIDKFVNYARVKSKLLDIPPCEIKRIIESVESGQIRLADQTSKSDV